MKSSLALFVLSCFVLISVNAWWETGHMLVAQVAKQDLLARAPEVYKRAEEIALFVKGKTEGLSDSFIESAVWLDDIKRDQWNFFFGWHFTDRPFNPQGLNTPPVSEFNSMTAVNSSMKVLSAFKNLGKNSLAKSVYMRILLHVIGDLHQPLHNACLYNLTFPDGDMGGNTEKLTIKATGKSMLLHSYWDSCAGKVPNDFKRPLAPENVTIIEGIAQNFTTEFTRDMLKDKLADTNVDNWVADNFLDAVEYGYKALRSDWVVDEVYEKGAYDVIRRNIALGGYRLSDLLVQALSAEIQPKHKEVDVELVD